MGVKKKTLSFPEEVWSVIEDNARRAHTTPSAYVSELIMKQEHLRRGLAAVAEWEAEHGAFTAEEDAWADRVLDAVDRSDGGVIELDDFEPMPESLKRRR
jgi:hypothetical protein